MKVSVLRNAKHVPWQTSEWMSKAAHEQMHERERNEVKLQKSKEWQNETEMKQNSPYFHFISVLIYPKRGKNEGSSWIGKERRKTEKRWKKTIPTFYFWQGEK